MPLLLPGILFAATMAVRQDQAALRDGCEASDLVVAKVPAGSPVEIRFAMSGAAETCYKVSVTVAGKTLNGYLAGSALAGLETFEQGLRSAPAMEVSKQMDSQIASMQTAAVSGPPNHPLVRASNLLKDKQPKQALELVEQAMRVTGRDRQYLLLAGIAAYQSDEVKKALDYFKEAQDFQQEPIIATWIAKIQNELKNDRSGEKLYGNRFLLRYEGGVLDADVARTMVTLLEDEFSRISLQLGCRTDDRIVTIVQSRDNYRKTVNVEWSGGSYDGKIRVPVLETKSVAPQTRTTFAHETVHACLANMGTFPAWLHEGLAQKLSGEPLHPNLKVAVRAALKQKQLPKLTAMGHGFGSMDAQSAALAYGYSRVAADLFVERYQSYGIQNILRSPERLPQIEAELDKLLAE
jgi:hypothetical protein